MKKQKFFDSTTKLFKDYQSKMIREKVKGYDSNLSNEVHLRLWQLTFICEKIRYYEENVIKCPRTNLREHRRFIDEGMVFAEAFYFFAWRIIWIASKTKLLPGLEGLKEKAKGVTLVRNSLIEHPETTKEKLFMVSYAWGGKEGPTLKIARSAGQTFEIRDCGLWINAQEFKDGLEELLQKAMEKNK